MTAKQKRKTFLLSALLNMLLWENCGLLLDEVDL